MEGSFPRSGENRSGGGKVISFVSSRQKKTGLVSRRILFIQQPLAFSSSGEIGQIRDLSDD
jgi:hypothetical protein